MAGSRPKSEVLGTFSINEDGEYRNDLSQRRFLLETDDRPPLPLDIRDGIDTFIGQGDVGTPSMLWVLKWIHDHREELIERKILETDHRGIRRLNVDFVGSAEVISVLLRAGESIGRLEFLVSICNGTIYIDSTDSKTPPRSEEVSDPPLRHTQPPPVEPFVPVQLFQPRLRCSPRRSAKEPRRQRTSYHSDGPSTSRPGTPERNEQLDIEYAVRKFAMSFTSPDGKKSNVVEPVNGRAKYVAVMKTQHSDHKILLSSEVEAERKDLYQAPPGNYVAIRTRKDQLNEKAKTNFNRYDTLEWWSEAEIAGIPEVMCGMRDDRRKRITFFNNYDVDKLHGKPALWDARICRKMFNSYLSYMKARITGDDPRAVYRLVLPKLFPGKGIKERLKKRKFIIHELKEEDYVILTDQYLHDVLSWE